MTREIDLGPLAQIPLGEGREFEVADRLIAVFRPRIVADQLADGSASVLYATQARCPHREASLSDGLLGGETLICPFHAWKFNLATGQPLYGECGLRTYPVRQTMGGRIVLTVDDGADAP